MNIWKISLQNLKSKPLYTVLSVFSLALSITLLLGMQQLKTSFEYQMENNLGKIDLVVGAKGSPLQLVLASVLHLDNPTGNISYDEAKKIANSPMIKTAVPISYGDNYKGYRIVGTTKEFLGLYDSKLEKGREFNKTFEVVIGNAVAEQTKLAIGDTFKSSHGLIDNDIDVHDELFTVVGILQPTHKAIDRLIVCNLESIWDLHAHGNHEGHGNGNHNDDNHDEHGDEDHDHEDHNDHDHDEHGDEDHDHEDHDDHDHDEHGDEDHEGAHKHAEHSDEQQITSLLISFKNPAGYLTFPRTINKNTNMQAALPKYELDRLYEFTGVGFKTITWIAYLILILSGITIFISLYKMVKEQAFDLAILRTYGASHWQLIRMVAYEGVIVAIIAFLFGLIITIFGLPFMFKFVDIGFKESFLRDLPFLNILQIALIVFAIISISIVIAVSPIMKMKISDILSNEK